MTVPLVLTMVRSQFIFMRSPTETHLHPEAQQSQLPQYALIIVATVESLMDTNEQADAPTYEPASDLMTSKRIPLITSCSSYTKKPWHVCASQQSIQTSSGTITSWSLKFDCSYTDLFSHTATDEIRAITFTVSSDATNKDLRMLSIEASNNTPVVVNLQSGTDHQKRTQILKKCKEIVIPLLVELEIVRHRALVHAAINKSFQKD